LSEADSESEEIEEPEVKEKDPIDKSYHFGDTSSDEEQEKKVERNPKYAGIVPEDLTQSSHRRKSFVQDRPTMRPLSAERDPTDRHANRF
jgi:hypothetical protein